MSLGGSRRGWVGGPCSRTTGKMKPPQPLVCVVPQAQFLPSSLWQISPLSDMKGVGPLIRSWNRPWCGPNILTHSSQATRANHADTSFHCMCSRPFLTLSPTRPDALSPAVQINTPHSAPIHSTSYVQNIRDDVRVCNGSTVSLRTD